MSAEPFAVRIDFPEVPVPKPSQILADLFRLPEVFRTYRKPRRAWVCLRSGITGADARSRAGAGPSPRATT